MKYHLQPLVALAIPLGLPPCAALGQGTVIAQHLGPQDPLTEGFSLYGGGGASLSPVAGGPLGGAWSIALPAADDIALYTRTLTPEEQAGMLVAGWTLSLTVQITPPYNSTPFGMFAAVLLGGRNFYVDVGATSAGDPLIYFGLPGGTASDLQGAGAGYHTYQIRYVAATQDASLWADGAQYAVVPIGSTAGTPGLTWGGGQRGSPTINANWSEVTLTIVPEPTWLGLFCFGGLGLVGRRWRMTNG